LLVTDNKDIYLRAREYSDHGHEQNPNFLRGEDTRSSWGFNYKANELQGAIGMAQLKKIDFILERQRQNKNRIKEVISGIAGIDFREIPNPGGDASDTLIFFVQSREKASTFTKRMLSKGVGTKNLPDAINWHFAGAWTHIFYAYPQYQGKDLEKIWSQSTGYLKRAVALPIMVNMSDERIEQIIRVIKDTAKEVC
jgi:8-amino-3,8-dideoxy-alpha-D-manno-octulosonate transaminase